MQTLRGDNRQTISIASERSAPLLRPSYQHKGICCCGDSLLSTDDNGIVCAIDKINSSIPFSIFFSSSLLKVTSMLFSYTRTYPELVLLISCSHNLVLVLRSIPSTSNRIQEYTNSVSNWAIHKIHREKIQWKSGEAENVLSSFSWK